MNYKLFNRITALAVFLISAYVLFSTVQPSVSFWDCGEFTAAAYYLQVPHPPGTPLFTMLGRVFSIIPLAANAAFRVNTISVLASALSVLFLYLIAVKLIENYKDKSPARITDALFTYIAAAIGALSFSFSDTFWFNGVEAEVYALSTFLFASITYLMVLWNEKAEAKDNEKYILLIAYLVGLSTGVHLMSVLSIVSVVMMVLFKKYVNDDAALKKSAYLFLGHAVVISVAALALWNAQTSPMPPSQEEYRAFDEKFILIMAGISLLIIFVFRKIVFSRNSIYLPIAIGGAALFITYPGVVKLLPGMMTGISGGSVVTAVILLLVLFAVLGYLVHYSNKTKKPELHLVFMSLIFILLGFTTYTMIIIRSNLNPPMNENRPNDFSELVSYLNREQYGDFPVFKRRFAPDQQHGVVFSGYTSDLDFFWRYQMNHMMTRYLLWNYAGRESWVQDCGVDISPFNDVGNLIGKPLGINFSGSGKNSLYAVPFLIGLIGIFFHFGKDWKMAAVFMVLFLFMGYLTTFYQNQQQPQPREREYFYVGAFFIYSIWIALGIRGIIDFVFKKLSNAAIKNSAAFVIIVLGIVFIPFRMAEANYFTHDRSRNWFPWDYAYNMLQSCAPNAILFTNGDNDTFPLWYLQDVEGVRRDVKVANLSLLNTPWYIYELKHNDPYNAGTVNISLTDEQIKNILPIQWEPQDVTIDLPQNATAPEIKDMYRRFGISDSGIINQGGFSFRLNNTINYEGVHGLRVQDIMVKDIVESNFWKRPIYFAVTCNDDSKIGLNYYLRMEGMAFRLVPEKGTGTLQFVNPQVLHEELFVENPGFSKAYNPNFKFRGINDSTLFFDDNHTRMIQNYRNAFLSLAIYYLNSNRDSLAVRTLDLMEEKIPSDFREIRDVALYETGNIYFRAASLEKYKRVAAKIEKIALKKLEENPSDLKSYYNPYRLLLSVYDNLSEYGKSAEVWEKIKAFYPDDPGVKANIEKYKRLAAQKDSASKNSK